MEREKSGKMTTLKQFWDLLVLLTKWGNISATVISQLEVPYLIEAAPNESASCHKIVAPPQNRSAWSF